MSAVRGVLDHLVVTADRLDAGVAKVEAATGMAMSGGGTHDVMGTHNRLLSLGMGEYLEVIAVDPDAAAPKRARWFDLDRQGAGAALSHWALRVDDLDRALREAPVGAGEIVALSRGPYQWRMAVPQDGRLPFDGLFPGLIEWDGPHPADEMPGSEARLVSLTLSHPDAEGLSQALSGLISDPRLRVICGPKSLTADVSVGAEIVRLT
ncbi:VOC family protein [Maritimibacter dapengensis]|uniref:VOC family protein n=1 Tax=Maritimibacter dapengensis TaxID=2836868 RepID=A0ABS6T0E7_9RHOB|nr:VOC family protein [Maritimibacter dapengensis]MBV7378665.1 VOC family protein [Maritimibacter dapengensis]